MKPEWSDVPAWANWIARDKDGQWRAYENKPIADDSVGYHRPNNGKHEVINHWTETTESRP